VPASTTAEALSETVSLPTASASYVSGMLGVDVPWAIELLFGGIAQLPKITFVQPGVARLTVIGLTVFQLVFLIAALNL